MPIKAVLIGDSGVGKTCLYDRIADEIYDDGHTPTIGGAFRCIRLKNASGDIFEIGLWDTAGQERFRTLMPMYFERAQLLLFVYSITDPKSIESLSAWYDAAMERAEPDAKVFILGNKCDLEDQDRQVSFDELNAADEKYGAFVAIEVSAKAGRGIDDVTAGMVRACEQMSQPGEVQRTQMLQEADSGERKKSKCC
jgi:small GTP-binding protein